MMLPRNDILLVLCSYLLISGCAFDDPTAATTTPELPSPDDLANQDSDVSNNIQTQPDSEAPETPESTASETAPAEDPLLDLEANRR